MKEMNLLKMVLEYYNGVQDKYYVMIQRKPKDEHLDVELINSVNEDYIPEITMELTSIGKEELDQYNLNFCIDGDIESQLFRGGVLLYLYPNPMTNHTIENS
jgi:hypothetical protein